MYSTQNMKVVKRYGIKKFVEETNLNIEVSNRIKCSGYNPFQTGYGINGKNKKDAHKADRKNAKQICREYMC